MNTSFILWFGGQSDAGVADSRLIVGAVISLGTVNVAWQVVVNGAQPLV
jgi:hypothetical protein